MSVCFLYIDELVFVVNDAEVLLAGDWTNQSSITLLTIGKGKEIIACTISMTTLIKTYFRSLFDTLIIISGYFWLDGTDEINEGQ
jgi:hypothetical protein